MTEEMKANGEEPIDESAATAQGPREETEQVGAEEMPTEINIEDILGYFIGMINEQAWIKLGIRANPMTGETKLDAAQAKLAIDALAALLPLLEGRIEAHVMRDLRNQLASLQMNYVQRQAGGGA